MSKPTILSLSMLLRNSLQWEILTKDFELYQLSDLNPDSIGSVNGLDPASVVAVVMGDQPCGGKEMDLFPKLKTIARPGVGYNAIDVEAAKKRGIVVTRVTSTHVEPVAEFALGLLLSLQMRIAQSHHFLVDVGDWQKSRVRNGRLNELTVGIVGLGAIGRRLGRLLNLLDIPVLVWNRSTSGAVTAAIHNYGMKRVDTIVDLVQKSDAIVLCLTLNDETNGIFNEEMVGHMKKAAFLVNVGRGPLVDEDALAEAIEENRIGGAALDVFAEEPPVNTHSFKRLREQALSGKNVILTGHTANLGVATAEKTTALVTENVKAVLEGRPENAEIVFVA